MLNPRYYISSSGTATTSVEIIHALASSNLKWKEIIPGNAGCMTVRK
jgi:hypothetical protein